jgi:hypothetical protein
MYSIDLPFPRGSTASQGLATVDATVLANLEGMEYVVRDEDPATNAQRTGRPVRLRAVRNKTGAAILPKRLVTGYTSGVVTAQVAGYARTTAVLCRGVVDEYLPAAGCPDNDLCYIVVEGPSLCLTDLAGGANNVINVETVLVALTAATSGATTAGRVAPQDLTGATALLAAQVANAVGLALTAKTTANTNADVLVDVFKL